MRPFKAGQSLDYNVGIVVAVLQQGQVGTGSEIVSMPA